MAETDPSATNVARRRFGVGTIIVLALAALALTVGIGIVRGALAPTEPVPVASDTVDAPAVTPAPDAAPAELYVHVAGAVRAPGLYVLAAGARVVDAVAAAGGFADDADRSAVNLARVVTDGEQLYVPTPGEQIATPAEPAGAPGDGRVNLNTADVAALDTLPRIGPAIAQRIIDWRDEHGTFTSVEDLLAVPGIGEKMLDALRDLVVV
ncbi:ComEA family DNA-binding protein [Microbacterium sp. C7(2022)]|uniref:ComEA family DNA-binding protein n=1 Tax=Microbacterium sp. C7(2022) TaxID=2992759 RepID=UPI00237A682E|nr:ComEA family DNA-binding protein [Microbacterium sp. C7(2022)]MDE0547008.1 ComEA family DNA-binding protein [Microbacterium sp. C7(2022)]